MNGSIERHDKERKKRIAGLLQKLQGLWLQVRGASASCVSRIAAEVSKCFRTAPPRIVEVREWQISELLNARSDLRGLCSEPIIPYELDIPRSQGERFVIIWILLQPELVSRGSLLAAITQSISLVVESGLASGLKGMEVVPSVRRTSGETDRIFRAMVEAKGYSEIANLDEQSLESKNPRTGIFISWYWDPGIVG